MKDKKLSWMDYASKVAFSALLPCLILPISLLIAAQSLILTTLVGIFISIILFVTSKYHKTLPKFHSFCTWVSLSVIFTIFQLNVVPLLLLTPVENFSCTTFMIIAILAIIKIKHGIALQVFSNNEKNSDQLCSICKSYTMQSQHVYWIDACVTSHTKKYYYLLLLSGIVGLLYSSNLTLTTICHPRRLFPWCTILIPDNCEDVYFLSELSIPFVSAVYSIYLAALLSFKLFALFYNNNCFRVSHLCKYSSGFMRYFVNCDRCSEV